MGELYLEQGVDNQDVEDILQRDDHTVEHRLQFGNSVDSFQRPRKREREKKKYLNLSNPFTKYLPQDSKQLDRLQSLTSGSFAKQNIFTNGSYFGGVKTLNLAIKIPMDIHRG